MKRSITTSLFVLIGLMGFSQTNQDPKAKAILDELGRKTKAYTSIKADFTVVIQSRDKSKQPDSQKGSLVLKGSNYNLTLKGQEIISDGKNSWTYLKDNNEVQVNEVDPKDNENVSPTTIFTIYEKGYKYQFVSESGSTQVINLYPINPEKKKFHTIKLEIDKVKKQLSSFTVLMKDGSSMVYSINSFVTNQEVAASLFTFDAKKHPGVEVVDLRDH